MKCYLSLGLRQLPRASYSAKSYLFFWFSAVHRIIGLDILLDHLVRMNLENIISQWFLKDQMLENFYSTPRSQIYGIPQSLTEGPRIIKNYKTMARNYPGIV